MSDPDTKTNAHEYYRSNAFGRDITHPSSPSQLSYPRPSKAAEGAVLGSYVYTRPQLNPHRSLQYPLGAPKTMTAAHEQHRLDKPVMGGTMESLRTSPYHSSSVTNVPTSRITHSAPPSPDPSQNSAHMEPDDLELVDFEQPSNSERPQMTASELRAHKRRMKRFRLTHTQSRYLMSEFARQAHPDAAHRERLSREIPGLSPRQVQVWFQNRRAKMKRLTSDDREYMLRSRALPEDFDTKQALHGSYGAPTSNFSTPIPPAGFSGSQLSRPYSTSGTPTSISSHENYAPLCTASTGNTPALNAFTFTPTQPTTAMMSPASFNGSDSGVRLYSHEPITRNIATSGHLRYPATHNTGYSQGHTQIPRDYSSLQADLPTWPTTTQRQQSHLQTDPQFLPERSSYAYNQIQGSNTASTQNISSASPATNGLPYTHLSPHSIGGAHQLPHESAFINGSTNTPPYHRSRSFQSTLSPSHGAYSSFNIAGSQSQQSGISFDPQTLNQSFEPRMSQRRHTYGVLPQQNYNPSIDQFYGLDRMANEQAAEMGDNSDGGVPLPSSF